MNSAHDPSQANANSALPPLPPLQEQLLLAFGCVVRGHDAVYISGPITTGPRFVEWYRAVGHQMDLKSVEYRQALRSAVVKENECDILRVAALHRKKSGSVVIEPTGLEIPNWEQAEFHAFWTEVLRRFCKRMIVVSGWEYSVGAAVEFASATKFGIRVENELSEIIGAEQGRSLIRQASIKIQTLSNGREFLERLSNTLRSYSTF